MQIQYSNLYREEILEHYQNPRNFGKIKKADAYSRQTNPLCGDDISMWIKFGDRVIKDIGFLGKGCAICIASASILTDNARGKQISELTKLGELDMLSLLGIQVSETRKKCALLPLAVLKDCLYAESKS